MKLPLSLFAPTLLLAAPVASAQCPEVLLEIPAQAAPSSGFGAAIALGEGLVFVGARQEPVGGLGGAGTVWVMTRQGTDWAQTGQLVASDPQSIGGFGVALALDGDRLLVGAEGAQAAYVFEPGPAGWTEVQRLAASDADAFTHFGRAVALQGDRLLVGAHRATANGVPGAGAVYVFERQGGLWVETEKLVSAAPQYDENFGFAVALDGDDLLVGAPGYVSPNFPIVDGRAEFFERQGGVYARVASFDPVFMIGPPEHPGLEVNNNQFGTSVALEGDRALVGAPQLEVEHSGTVPAGHGQVYAYERVAGTWMETQLLKADPGAPDEGFGNGVALDGARAVVHAPYEATPAELGVAHLFEDPGTGWSRVSRTYDKSPVGLSSHRGFAFRGGWLAMGGSSNNIDDGVQLWAVSLCTREDAVSVSLGGRQGLALHAGLEEAGHLFVFFGSATGTWPGFPLDGIQVPLVPDAYTLALLSDPGGFPLPNGVGFLGAEGRGSATFAIPGGLPGLGGLAGLDLYHAYATFDPLTGAARFASNAMPVELVP